MIRLVLLFLLLSFSCVAQNKIAKTLQIENGAWKSVPVQYDSTKVDTIDVHITHGNNGSNGATGSQGAKGDKGDTGNTGATGAAGSNGTNGTNGIAIYRQGTLKTAAKEYLDSAVVSGGTVTFPLTLDHTSTGTAIFTNVYKESANFRVDDNAAAYQFGGFTLSANKKTLTMTATKLGTTSANALLNLIGGVVSVVTGITFTAAPNGVVVHLSIKGD